MHIQHSRFEVPPERRDEYIESRREGQLASREDEGCLEYVVSADPTIPSRVHFFALWESHEAHEAHKQANRRRNEGQPQSGDDIPVTDRTNYIYEVSERTWEPGRARQAEPPAQS